MRQPQGPRIGVRRPPSPTTIPEVGGAEGLQGDTKRWFSAVIEGDTVEMAELANSGFDVNATNSVSRVLKLLTNRGGEIGIG